MMESGLRRKIAWLIAIRAIISTILLGSAIVTQITAPGSFAVDPFFFLIGLTYALTIAFALTVRYVDEHRWLVDIQLAGDALIVSAFIYVTGGITSYFTSLYVLPIVAASTVQFRRGGMLVATLSTVLYVGLVAAQYMAASGLLNNPWPTRYALVLPSPSVARYTVALNVFGFFAVAFLSGSLADSLKSAGARLQQASTQIADLQALNQHVIDSLPSGLATTDQSDRILTFNRAAQVITGVPFQSAVGRPIGEVMRLPAPVNDAHSSRAAPAGHAAPRVLVPIARRPRRHRGRPERHAPRDAGRTRGVPLHLSGRHEHQETGAGRRHPAAPAAVGEMAAGIAHEIRNPLASMSGSIQILRQELPLSAEQDQLMDIVLRESERLNTTIRSFLAYARPQRFQIAAIRRAPRLERRALLLRNSAEVQDSHEIVVDVPRASSGTRPTKGRSSRSSGTWRPTVSARCPTVAGSVSRARSSPRRRRRADGRGRGDRHSRRGAGRPLSAV
jgi:two-component system sensor histidine kinase PilS (NtrC family)